MKPQSSECKMVFDIDVILIVTDRKNGLTCFLCFEVKCNHSEDLLLCFLAIYVSQVTNFGPDLNISTTVAFYLYSKISHRLLSWHQNLKFLCSPDASFWCHFTVKSQQLLTVIKLSTNVHVPLQAICENSHNFILLHTHLVNLLTCLIFLLSTKNTCKLNHKFQ